VKLIVGKELDQSTLSFYKATIGLDFLKPDDNMIFEYEVNNTITGYKVIVNNKLFDFTQDKERREVADKLRKAETWDSKAKFLSELSGPLSSNDVQVLLKQQQEGTA